MKKLLLSIFALSVSLLSAANISLNGVEYTIDTLSMYPAGPGTMFYELRMLRAADGSNRLDCWLMAVDTRDPYVGIEQILGKDQVTGLERPSDMAKRKTTDTKVFFGGVNGDFYANSTPVGTTIVNNEYALTPAGAGGGRRAGGVDADNKGVTAYTHAYSMQVTLPDGSKVAINHANGTREENQLVLYNRHKGVNTGTNAYGTEVKIALLDGEKWATTGTMKVQVLDVQDNIGSMPLAYEYAVLSAHGTKATALKALQVGDVLTLDFEIRLDGEAVNVGQMIGGDHYEAMILDDGKIATTGFWDELHPRTGFGVSQSRDTVFFLVVDGRGVSKGCTTKVMAEILKYYGAWNAVNWDGGGSSCMYVRPFDQVNKGSDGNERTVTNGMFAVANVPTADNTITRIAPALPMYTLPPYAVLNPTFYGYNQYGVLIDTNVKGVRFSCEADMGQVLEDGSLRYAGIRSGKVTAHYGEATTEIEIRLSEVPMAFRLDSVLCDGKHAYVVENQAIIGNDTINMSNDILTWTSSDPDVATVSENGEIVGVSNGFAMITGATIGFEDSIKVRVEIPTTREMLWTDFRATSLWTMKGSAGFAPSLVVPETIDEPVKLVFTYKSARNPFVQIVTDSLIYSRPEKLHIPMATDAVFKEVVVLIRPANEKQAKTLRYTNLTGEQQIEIDVEENFGNDIAIYPLHFESLKFSLDTSTEKGERYVSLPGIVQIYDVNDVQTNLEGWKNATIEKKLIQDGVLYIQHAGSIYTILGEKIK